MKNLNIFVFLIALSGLVFAKNTTDYKQVKIYTLKTHEGLSSFYTARLYDNGMGSCYMICDFATFTSRDDMPSSWIFKCTKNNVMIECKNDDEEFIMKILQGNLLLPKYSKALGKQIKAFDKMAFFEDSSESHEAFFKVYQFHKAPAARRYAYIFYSTEGRLACYNKFEEIFGSEALIEFQNSK
jgi:hypothetical protein